VIPTKTNKINLAIFASGTGSNADKICMYFKDHPDIKVDLIISNNINAGVLSVAASHGIESVVIPKSSWKTAENVLPELKTKEITHIILAGFLLLVPQWLISEYNGRILNIHPALLPRYGGKGMFGHHIHEKVKSSGDLISGITIHEVNENYDEGKIIFQETIKLTPDDTASIIGQKVLQLEHYHYPRIIEQWVMLAPKSPKGNLY
jgi:phosphoribosylglycinamide formyltransferase-1